MLEYIYLYSFLVKNGVSSVYVCVYLKKKLPKEQVLDMENLAILEQCPRAVSFRVALNLQQKCKADTGLFSSFLCCTLALF